MLEMLLEMARRTSMGWEGGQIHVLGLFLPQVLESLRLFLPASSQACTFLHTGGTLVSQYGLLNDLGSLLSQCKQFTVAWPCCVGLSTLSIG